MRRILVLGGLLLALAPAPAADAWWKIKGKGWGHGVGLSQWGAHGYAQHGWGWQRILHHYYANVNIRETGGHKIKVLLQSGQGLVAFDEAKHACGVDLRVDRRFKFDKVGGDVILRGPEGHRRANCGGQGTARGPGGVHVIDKGRYRGEIHANAEPSGLAVINHVALEDYIQGVVPNEVPYEWPADALRAQAVAARSYVLATRGSGMFDVYDDTRSQVYGGKGTERASTNAAVAATDHKVVKHSGNIATTYYFSTSGGRTENSEYGFAGGSSRPWLKSVIDRYDDPSPHHEWTVSFSEDQMRSKLSGLFSGRLVGINALKRGRSPRIVNVRINGSSGDSTVSGATLQSRLGTRSTWMFFDRR